MRLFRGVIKRMYIKNIARDGLLVGYCFLNSSAPGRGRWYGSGVSGDEAINILREGYFLDL